MALQIIICLILLYPLYLSLDQCVKILKGNYSATFMAGTLVNLLKFPKWLVLIISLVLPVLVVGLGFLIMMGKPVAP